MTTHTQNDTKTTGSGAIPFPPRRRWLKRMALILLVLIALAAGVRVWWGYYADRRVAAFLAQAKAEGEPSSPADLQTPPIPDKENGTILIAQASDQCRLSDEEYYFLQQAGHWLPASPQEKAVWNKLLADVAPSLHLVRLSRSRPSLHSVYKIDQVVQREARRDATLANILARLASQEWDSGDFEAAMDHLLDIVQIARAMRSDAQVHDMFWQSLSVDSSCLMIALEFAQPNKIQRDLIARISDRYQGKIRALIELFSDETELRHAFENTCYSEGLRDLRQAGFTANSIEAYSMLDRLLGPAARVEAVRAARRHFALARLANQPAISFDSGVASLPPRDEKQGPNVRLWLATEARTGPWPEGMLDTYCRFLAYRRISVVALGLHLYALDHKWALPGKLNELVPTYLAAIPRDPSGTMRPSFMYEVTAADRADVCCPSYLICIFVGNWRPK